MPAEVKKYWTYKADPQQSVQACETIEEEACGWGLPDRIVFKVSLIVEELFQNSIRHAKNETNTPVDIEITMEFDQRKVHLSYKEKAHPFDLLDEAHGADHPEQRIGGQGIHLMKGLSDQALYTYENGWNRADFQFSRDLL